MSRTYTPKYDFKKLEEMAEYIIETKCTIRECGKEYNISSSTLSRRFNVHLKEYNFKLYQDLKAVLDINYKERSIRGGKTSSARSQKYNDEIFKLFKKYATEKDNIARPYIIRSMISEDVQMTKWTISLHVKKLIKKEKIKIKDLYGTLSLIEIKENE